MKTSALVVVLCVSPHFAASPEEFYSVSKGPEGYFGKKVGPTQENENKNEITIIKCGDTTSSTYKKDDGYHWTKLETDPCKGIVRFIPALAKELSKAGVEVKENAFAIVDLKSGKISVNAGENVGYSIDQKTNTIKRYFVDGEPSQVSDVPVKDISALKNATKQITDMQRRATESRL